MRLTLRELKRLIREVTYTHKYDKNPFVYSHRFAEGLSVTVGFYVPNKSEPLWWTGSGFKDLSRVDAHAYEFTSEAEATQFIQTEAIPFIHKWRSDQIDLIKGW
jgi:hypothetical protein